MFSNLFNVNVDLAPNKLQMELIELQSNEVLKLKFNVRSLLQFYSDLPLHIGDFPKSLNFARKFVSIFGSTYKCEQLFSRMKFIKSKTRSRLTDLHLENNLRIATFNIPSNIEGLVKKIQSKKSH